MLLHPAKRTRRTKVRTTCVGDFSREDIAATRHVLDEGGRGHLAKSRGRSCFQDRAIGDASVAEIEVDSQSCGSRDMLQLAALAGHVCIPREKSVVLSTERTKTQDQTFAQFCSRDSTVENTAGKHLAYGA